ncbi:MAG: type 2 lantipeptide synthetase LanM family protein, partial [Alphaproteobacteria bacterium]|nr:type 2 lantipeptide synthetase LanM family protein [Alphaproteobacteria bacterium]
LGITDLHLENVLASEQNPYLVDVEAMFDRPVKQLKEKKTFTELYSQASHDLLFRTGLLPARMKGKNGVYDISAIGAGSDQNAPLEFLTVENFGSDEIRLVAQPGRIFKSHNSPSPDDPTHQPHHYTNEIVDGFERTMSVFRSQKDFLASSKSVLRLFDTVEVRWVARATMDYGKFMEKMLHPSVVGDALQCDLLIGGDLSSTTDIAPHMTPIIPSEVADLWNYDVPYFSTFADSTDLYDSKGKVFKNFFEDTGLSGVKRRIDALNQPNPAQADAIVFALKSTAPPYRGDNQNTSPLRIKESHRVDVTPDALIGLAAEIGQGLISKTHYIERVPFWSGLIPLDDKNYTVGVLSPDLYSGASGIGLFMAYLYQETGDGAVREIALDIHNHIGFLLRTKSGLSTVGAFSGLSSLIYADLHLTSVLGLDSSHTYERSFRHIARMMDHDENFDIISGAAGALIVATRYHQRTGSPAAYATAIAAADKLGASAKPQHRGIAWETLKGFDFPEKVGGVSHGVSGIAWALSEWAACSGESKWAALAQQAFLYEESLYDKEAKAWKDVRNGSHSCFWCYGAAGIGLVASEATNALSKPVCDDVVSRAKKSTWKSGSSGSHGLCHGDLGNAEIFRVTGDRQKTDALVHSVVADYRNNGIWKCGFPDDAMVPGLMCGLAGIGYGLLRHARPNTIPNVLTLDFPVG